MEILQEYGLINPTINIFIFKEEELSISLISENSMNNPRIGKIFSYFESKFNEFLLSESTLDHVENLKKEFESKGIEIEKDTSIKEYFIKRFNKYLDANKNKFKEEIEKINIPEIVWKKIKSSTRITYNKEDIENGYAIQCLFKENIAKSKGNKIAHDLEVQTNIENILFRENIKTPKISVYYKILSETEIINYNVASNIKETMLNDYVLFYLSPTNDFTKEKFKKVVYLRKMEKFEDKMNLEKHKGFTTVEEADEEFLETSVSSLNELLEMCGEGNSKFKEIFSKELDNHKDKLEEFKK